MKFKIPEKIETDRLILRYFLEEDWKDLFEYYSDEVCMKFTVGRSLTKWETWRTLATMIGHWQLRGYGPYAIVEKEGGKVLGPVGMWFPLEWPEPEIKWGLSQKEWGKGYAREAALAVRIMAAEYMPDLQLISLIASDNTASIKVATSIGAAYEKDVPFRDGSDIGLYRHVSG